MDTKDTFKSGYVSIIGEPNVGKSTLLNALMGERLAIVTPKPQTTRNRITGIVTTDEYQIIFLDTPAVLQPKYPLHSVMVKAAYQALDDADLILYMVEVTQPEPPLEEKLLNAIRTAQKPTFLLLNKIDKVPKPTVLPLTESYQAKFPFSEILPISALKGDGIDQLRQLIVNYLSYGPLYFPEDQISNLPERFFVAETIREKIFLQTHQEIPYASSVVVEEFKERPNGKTYIRAIIFAERESQKRILIGDRGAMVKRIGQLARSEIERFLDARVFLELRVSVKKNWRSDARKLKDMGY